MTVVDLIRAAYLKRSRRRRIKRHLKAGDFVGAAKAFTVGADAVWNLGSDDVDADNRREAGC
jgi:hypothetical protein